MFRKQQSTDRVRCSLWLRASTGGLGTFPPWMRGGGCCNSKASEEIKVSVKENTRAVATASIIVKAVCNSALFSTEFKRLIHLKC